MLLAPRFVRRLASMLATSTRTVLFVQIRPGLWTDLLLPSHD